jgi:dipeptidyl aminopeptidase/acylaminoacyl peptidase
MGEVGDREHVDIMSGVEYVLDNYEIDSERMAVRGWSWGGVSSGYLITQVHKFKAASVGAGVFNWAAETGQDLISMLVFGTSVALHGKIRRNGQNGQPSHMSKM